LRYWRFLILQRLSSALVFTWAAVSTAAAQQNDLAFIARPCPSNISSPQVHMVIPIVVGGISIPYIVCASLGPGLTLDLSGAVPTLNAGPAGSPAGVTVAVNGTVVGAQPTLNLISGNGIIEVCSNNLASSRVDCTPAVDANYIISQDGTPRAVVGTSQNVSGTVMYLASMNPVLLSYAPNKAYTFLPNVNCGDLPAINIDGLGPVPIKKLSAGALAPLNAGDCVGGIPYLIITHFNSGMIDAFVLRP
jgi:hypothetical protein